MAHTKTANAQHTHHRNTCSSNKQRQKNLKTQPYIAPPVGCFRWGVEKLRYTGEFNLYESKDKLLPTKNHSGRSSVKMFC